MNFKFLGLTLIILATSIGVEAKKNRANTIQFANNGGPDAGFGRPGGSIKDLEAISKKHQIIIGDIKKTSAFKKYVKPFLIQLYTIAPEIAYELTQAYKKIWYQVESLPESNNGYLRFGLQNEHEVYILSSVISNDRTFADLIIHELFVAYARSIWTPENSYPTQTDVENLVGSLLYNQNFLKLESGEQLISLLKSNNFLRANGYNFSYTPIFTKEFTPVEFFGETFTSFYGSRILFDSWRRHVNQQSEYVTIIEPEIFGRELLTPYDNGFFSSNYEDEKQTLEQTKLDFCTLVFEPKNQNITPIANRMRRLQDKFYKDFYDGNRDEYRTISIISCKPNKINNFGKLNELIN